MSYRTFFVAASLVAAAVSAAAQQTGAAVPPSQQTTPVATPPPAVTDKKEPQVFKSEVRLQGLMFGNFFQAPAGSSTQDVYGIQTAYRGTYRPRGTKTDYYGEASLMRFTNIDRANPYSLRIGTKHDDALQSYEVFLDRGAHRAAFAVGNRTAFATVTTISGQYGYKISPHWTLGGELLQERQRFDVHSNQENNYTRGTLLTRYRGFGEIFQPYVGYSFGHRNVENNFDSYREHYWSAGFTTMSPNYRTYASLGYENSHRLFDAAYAVPGNFSRDDAHPQWSGYVAYRLSQRWSTLLYASREVSSSPLPSRNYNSSFVLLGLTAHF